MPELCKLLARLMLLACHKKSYYFQAAVSALLAVSVMYVEKKIKINVT